MREKVVKVIDALRGLEDENTGETAGAYHNARRLLEALLREADQEEDEVLVCESCRREYRDGILIPGEPCPFCTGGRLSGEGEL